MTQDLTTFLEKHKLGQGFADTAQQWYIPFADRIALHHNSAERPFLLGVNGCQGSGKSTLTDFLADYLSQTHHKKVVCLSLDDFYLDQPTRQELAQTVHPLLATRGVPGTHHTDKMHDALLALKDGKPAVVPRFDKSTDNPKPQSQWTKLDEPHDVVIFEGWCWGVDAQAPESLETPANALEANEDKDGVWRRYVNEQLASHYAPLYGLMDQWCMLKAPNFDCVFQWRLEQEQKLMKSLGPDEPATGVMNEQQIGRFIQHYQRLTEHALATLPEQCDLVFELDSQRRIQRAQEAQQ